MDFFKWNEQFLTGQAVVDEQHQRLVAIINHFIECMTQKDNLPQTEIDAIFNELLDYAQEHFREEESLMQSAGIDAFFFEHHQLQHQAYLREVIRDKNRFHSAPDSAKSLIDFLGHWLIYHILGQDKSMARQIEAIQGGMSAADAFAQEQKFREATADPLLHALNTMIGQAMERNNQLISMNESLEARVDERTQALQQANASLVETLARLEERMSESRRLSAELSLANEHLQHQALTDVLTGLPNRRHAMQHLAQLWSASVRQGDALACIMLDVDAFKQVNDRHGHEAGDSVLCAIANLLQTHTRKEDLACRLGGDEFLILCPHTTEEGAFALAQHLHSHAKDLRLVFESGEWRGSLSLGVAARLAQTANPDELIKQADQALYLAKRQGRNQVAIYTNTLSTP